LILGPVNDNSLASDRQKSSIAALLTKARSINVRVTGTFPYKGCVPIPYSPQSRAFINALLLDFINCE